MALSIKDRIELIKRNTQEIVQEDELKELLESKKQPVVYLGTQITGKPSIAYFFPLLKMNDFVKAGFKVIFLLADLHGALAKTPWTVLEHRYDYYKEAITQMFKIIGTDLKKIEFIKGSEFQLKPEYSFDLLKLASMCSVRDCKKAASEVVKFEENPYLGGMIYPIMQALDEQYLNADVQYGGLDQRKILMFARENLPKIGYDRRVEVMTPMIPGLIGKKMSSSDKRSKIDLTDDEKTVREKINKADCVEGDSDNGVMAFLRYVIMVVKQDKKEKFVVEREKKYGGDIKYSSYEEIEKDFVKKELHPQDLKNAAAEEIIKLLKKADKDKLNKLAKKAYEEDG